MNKPNLPLSWIQSDKLALEEDKKIPLFNGLVWFALLYFSKDKNWIKEIKRIKNQKILIRGVNEPETKDLSRLGFRRYQTGLESIIDLSIRLEWKRSLREMHRRGKKLGRFTEIEYSKSSCNKLNAFKKISRHADKPELKYLFNNSFLADTRLFVIKDENSNWLGAILVSQNNSIKYQCELLLKRKGRYPGVMEYLLIEIAAILKKEGISELSLGEVPFKQMHFDKRSIKILLFLLKPILRISYSYEGLFFFKDKFEPKWEPVYLCSNRNITLLNLFLLSVKTNFLKLILYKIKMTLIHIK